MPDSVNILFICTGNSCRSQIAEGWARHIGINISGQESTVVDEQIMTEFRATRDEIKGRVSELLESIKAGQTR